MGIGLIFPGQGSQQVGMGADLVAKHAPARELFEQANEALGYDLKKLCLEGPEDELTLTYNAQPAILTVSTIAHRLLAARAPVRPLSLAGHSLGEYSALVAAGAMAFTDAVKAVHQRGRFMQEATPPGVGAMAAILGMDAAELEKLCEEEAWGQVVAPANFNAPGQIVISGHAEAVKRVLARCKGRLLQVSAPFHCALLAPAAEAMRGVLAHLSFADASAPVVANASSEFLQKAEQFPPSLVAQVTSPVRWDAGVKAMIAGGVDRLIEIGHGNVLGGLMKRIDRAVPIHNVSDDVSLGATLEAGLG